MPQWEFWLRVVLVMFALVVLSRSFDRMIDCYRSWRRRRRQK